MAQESGAKPRRGSFPASSCPKPRLSTARSSRFQLRLVLSTSDLGIDYQRTSKAAPIIITGSNLCRFDGSFLWMESGRNGYFVGNAFGHCSWRQFESQTSMTQMRCAPFPPTRLDDWLNRRFRGCWSWFSDLDCTRKV